jgi:hypothetical protein
MQTAALKKLVKPNTLPVRVTHLAGVAPRRSEVEGFIRSVFARCYGASVTHFAPNLLLLEQCDRIVAATGWRSAGTEALFLERYLDLPIESAMAKLANVPVERERIVEVGNLAAEKNGGSLHVIHALASHLDRLAYEWVVFTATQELIGIFTRLGLPLLALAKADPARLGADAADWGSYYATEPVIVAGRIRIAIERLGRAA